ncbi:MULTISPECIES: DUF4998 domain-containing protein [Chitinophaga]|nr:DUF4998 domain-containing protein [Chitinophaga chungangae]
MKQLIYTGLLLAAAMVAACNKADEDYKDFAPGGENVYPGKATELTASPGKNRIMLQWLLATDPRIVTCRIYWNRGKDSMDVNVQRTHGVDTISAVLGNMTEGPYLFEVYTYNAQGNRSIKTEINGDVYGEFYESNLLNRTLKKAEIVNGKARLEWDEADPRSPGVRLTFTDAGGTPYSILAPSSENVTILDVLPETGTLEFKTLYLPAANAIDTFAAPAVKVNL